MSGLRQASPDGSSICDGCSSMACGRKDGRSRWGSAHHTTGRARQRRPAHAPKRRREILHKPKPAPLKKTAKEGPRYPPKTAPVCRESWPISPIPSHARCMRDRRLGAGSGSGQTAHPTPTKLRSNQHPKAPQSLLAQAADPGPCTNTTTPPLQCMVLIAYSAGVSEVAGHVYHGSQPRLSAPFPRPTNHPHAQLKAQQRQYL